jgi:hypothetical protein
VSFGNHCQDLRFRLLFQLSFLFLVLFELGFFFSSSAEDDSVGVQDYRIEAGLGVMQRTIVKCNGYL